MIFMIKNIEIKGFFQLGHKEASSINIIFNRIKGVFLGILAVSKPIST